MISKFIFKNVLGRSNRKLIAPCRLFSTEHLRKFWNDFSDNYEKSTEIHTLPINMELYTLTNAHNSNSILETAVGAGLGSKIFVSNLLKKGGNYVACDLSDKMIHKIDNKFKKISEESSISYHSLAPNEENIKISTRKGSQIYSIRCSNENLPFANEQFKTYVSNFSLHLVDDHLKMLSEAKRVLLPEGSIGLSIWGRRKESPLFSMLPRIITNYGIKFPKQKSFFHLEGKIMDIMSTAGFRDIQLIRK